MRKARQRWKEEEKREEINIITCVLFTQGVPLLRALSAEGVALKTTEYLMKPSYRYIIIFLIICSAFTVFISVPKENEYARFADEGYYFHYAKTIALGGVSKFPELIDNYTKDPRGYLFPPPSRVGFIIPAAFWLKIFGVSFVSLATFSAFCFVLFLFVCYFYCKKYFKEDIALLFTLLLSSSPLLMGMGMRALMDSAVTLFWALSFWTFMDFMSEQKMSKYILFIVSFTMAFFVKEISLVLLFFFMIFHMVNKYYFKKSVREGYLVATVLIPPVLYLGFVFFICGGPQSVAGIVKGIMDARFGSINYSPYAVYYCSGPWFRYIIDFMLFSPFTTLLFIGYFAHLLLTKKIDWKTMYFLVFYTVIFIYLGNLRYSKVVRFVMSLEMVSSLFSVLFIYELFKNRKNQLFLVFSSSLFIFIINYLTFTRFFCIDKMYTVITFELMRVRELIPMGYFIPIGY